MYANAYVLSWDQQGLELGFQPSFHFGDDKRQLDRLTEFLCEHYGRPVAVTLLGAGLLVALADRAAIARVDPTLTEVLPIAVPCGGPPMMPSSSIWVSITTSLTIC